MRTLIVAHGFPPHANGGAELLAHWHATTLVREHHDNVLVIAREADRGRPEYALRREQRDGLSIAWINNNFAATRSFAETYDNPAITAIAAALIDAFRPDLAHIHHLTCLSTGIVPFLAERGIPCIVTLHDYWLMCHRGQLLDRHLQVCAGPEPDGCRDCLGLAAAAPTSVHRAAAVFRAVEQRLPAAAATMLRGAAEAAATLTARVEAGDAEARARLLHMRAICAAVTRFVAPSASIRDRFIAFGVAPEKITVVPYGIPRPPFAEIARTPAPGLRIGFLGSVMVSKGLHVLLDAYRQLPVGAATVDVFGAIVAYHGDDSYRATLAPLLAQDGVRQHGAIPHGEVGRVFEAIDVLVVPSIWPENLPLVVHEAFLAGVPVVASRIGGLPELVTDGVNGLLFTPGDADDLARALGQLLTEPGLMARLRDGRPAVRDCETEVATLRGLGLSAIAERPPLPAIGALASRIAAVVLNYRTPDETVLAVRSLEASRRPIEHIIVVDNDAAHPCADRFSDDPAVAYIAAGRNLGYSGGVNLGIREARRRGATHVLLVNSDVIVPPDCVAALERALASSPGAGIAGPLILSRSAPDRVASFGISYSLASGRMRHRDHNVLASALNGPAVRAADAAAGAVLLISTATLDRVGDFDESYFFSFEEIDFCLRARRAGIATVVSRDAVVFHAGGQSMGPESSRRLYFAARNHLKLAAAHGGGSFSRSHVVAGLNVLHALRAPGGTWIERVGAVSRGIRDHWRGRYGTGE